MDRHELHEDEYQIRLVAFNDILGFSALVQKIEKDVLYAEKLFNALESIREEVEHNKKTKRPKTQQ